MQNQYTDCNFLESLRLLTSNLIEPELPYRTVAGTQNLTNILDSLIGPGLYKSRQSGDQTQTQAKNNDNRAESKSDCESNSSLFTVDCQLQMAQIQKLARRLEQVSTIFIQQSSAGQLFTRHRQSQEDRITKRRLELQARFNSFPPIPNDWRLVMQNQTIVKSDMETLKPTRDLNGEIINFYLKLLSLQILDEDMRSNYCFFNTYFMSKLVGDSLEDEKKLDKISKRVPPDFLLGVTKNYERVKKWTRRVDLFSKRYIVIPIHMPSHWAVIIIVNLPCVLQQKQGVILYLDSLGGKNKSIIEAVRTYLRMEMIDKKKGDPDKLLVQNQSLPDYQLLVPRQTNFHDCGLHMILNTESLLLNPSILHQDFKEIQNRKQLNLYPRSLSFTIRSRLVDLLMSYRDAQGDQRQRKLAINSYLQTRNSLIRENIPDVDYDKIDSRELKKFVALNNKRAKDPEEAYEELVMFYMKAECNFFETTPRSQ